MSVLVACDVCFYRYHIDEPYLGKEMKCKQCRARFEATEFFPPAEEGEEGVTWQNLLETGRAIGTIGLILLILPAMISLLWIEPRLEQSAVSQTKNKSTQKTNSTQTNPRHRPVLQQPRVSPSVPEKIVPSIPPHTTPVQPKTPDNTPGAITEERLQEMLSEQSKAVQTPPPAQTPKGRSQFKVGELVEVEWGNKWYAAKVLKINGNKTYIAYVGYSNNWDEWVKPNRIRKKN